MTCSEQSADLQWPKMNCERPTQQWQQLGSGGPKQLCNMMARGWLFLIIHCFSCAFAPETLSSRAVRVHLSASPLFHI